MKNDEQLLEALYSGTDLSRIPDHLLAVLPRDKADIQRAGLAVELGYPKVQAVLPCLLRWLQDYNWPVADVLAPFLSGIGLPLENAVREILTSKDEIWKYWVLTLIVDVDDLALAKALKADLELLLTCDGNEDIPETAHKILDRLRGREV